MNILIVYDLAMNKAILERILRMDGHITVAAGRVDDPIYLLKKRHRFDLVILDMLKPESHGIEMYQSYLEYYNSLPESAQTQQLPFILLWPGQDEAHALRTAGRYKFAKEIGFVNVLSKPIVHARLKETLATVQKGFKPKTQNDPLGDIHLKLNELSNIIVKQKDKKSATMLINLMERSITKVQGALE